MADIIRHPITSREEWLALRRHDVTASEIGALFGCHPYRTIYGLAVEKRGHDIGGPDADAAVIRRGQALERVVADEVARLRPHWGIFKSNEYLRDPAWRIGATPDFYIRDAAGRRGVLQTKTVGAGKFKREWGTDVDLTPPFWITLQTLTEAMLEKADFGAVGVLTIGEYAFDAHVIEIARHAAAETRILAAAESFWGAYDKGEEPQPDYQRDGEMIAAMYPTAVQGKTVDLTGDNRIHELLEARQLNGGIIKEAEVRKKEAEAEIRHKLGDAELAIVRGWKVTCKTTHRKETVQAATTYRTLRTTRETTA